MDLEKRQNELEELYNDLDQRKLVGIILELTIENIDLKKQLSIHGVVKSLKNKETISFEDWKKRHIIDTDSFDNYLHDTEGWVEEKQLEKMYFREQNL